MFPLGDDNEGARGLPVMTVVLIILNVLVFLYEMTLDPAQGGELEKFIRQYGVIPAEIQHGQDWFTLITSMFVHGGLAHIGGNMLFLWVFGDNIERRWGSLLFVVVYFGTGLAASLAHIAFNSGSEIPSVGASGAISGVLGAYILLYPMNRIRVLLGYFVTAVPAFLFLGIWFMSQLINGLATLGPETAQTSGVAVWAHIGGFVAGAIAAIALRGVNMVPASAPSRSLRR